MILSKIYSSNPEIFSPVCFTKGINVVRGSIHDIKEMNRDTHNLGKTTFVQLINFCLLKRSDQSQFVHNVQFVEQMADVAFFLEIEYDDAKYITIKRPINNSTKISLKIHSVPNQDYSTLGNAHWNHAEIGFDRAKRLVDSYLNWSLPQGVMYRQLIPFLIREQKQYDNVFFKSIPAYLNQVTWKYLMARILGFDEKLIKEVKDIEDKLSSIKEEIKEYEKKLAGYDENSIDEVKTKLVEEQSKLEDVRKQIDAINLKESDDMVIAELVNEIDDKLADLNESFYQLKTNERRIEDALHFSPQSINYENIVKLYEEIGVMFPDSLKKDLDALIDFNQKIVRERKPILQDELHSIQKKLKELSEYRQVWYKRKEAAIIYIKESNSFGKLKELSSQLGVLQSIVDNLQKQYDAFSMYEGLLVSKSEFVKKHKDSIRNVQSMVDGAIEQADSVFFRISYSFSDIIKNVLNREATIAVKVSPKGNVDYIPSFRDELGESTDEGKGNTYAKLMCIAFDMAMVASHLHDRFPRWLIHDGIFEDMDERKRSALLDEMIQYSQLGVQHIVTMIDSEIPNGKDISAFLGDDAKVVLTLSDADDQGLLFKGVKW